MSNEKAIVELCDCVKDLCCLIPGSSMTEISERLTLIFNKVSLIQNNLFYNKKETNG